MHSRWVRLRHWWRRNKLKVELAIAGGMILGYLIFFAVIMAEHF